MSSQQRVRAAEAGAYFVAVAGLVALVTISLFFTVGQPFGTLNDLSLLVMTLALAPVMVGCYQLGGRTPLTPARVSLALGIAAIAIWSIAQAAMILGLVTFDYESGATGAFAVEAVALLVIGAWLVGAPVLADPWMTAFCRVFGVVSGVGFIVFGVGLLAGGVSHPLTYLGGIGYQVAFPIWGLLMGRLFGSILRARAAIATASPSPTFVTGSRTRSRHR